MRIAVAVIYIGLAGCSDQKMKVSQEMDLTNDLPPLEMKSERSSLGLSRLPNVIEGKTYFTLFDHSDRLAFFSVKEGKILEFSVSPNLKYKIGMNSDSGMGYTTFIIVSKGRMGDVVEAVGIKTGNKVVFVDDKTYEAYFADVMQNAREAIKPLEIIINEPAPNSARD